MLNAGVDNKFLRLLSEDQLVECGITNSIHRQRIFDAIRGETGFYDYTDNKPLDAFISYRRSTGSQLASLLKGSFSFISFIFLQVPQSIHFLISNRWIGIFEETTSEASLSLKNSKYLGKLRD